MTTNFEFVKDQWPQVYADAVQAETYGRSDPRGCVFYARRVIEQIVIKIYDLERLPAAYSNDLAARLGTDEFHRIAGPQVSAAANAIRKIGNIAVHQNRVISDITALNVLKQLHALTAWAARRYTTTPDRVHSQISAYNPALIPAANSEGSQPPLSAEELNRLLAMFEAKDAELAQEKRNNATMQAQIDRLCEQVAAAQRGATHPAADYDGDEAETRASFIDGDLTEAGWDLNEPNTREYPVTGMPNQQGTGYADYVLWGTDGLPLAVIEAKRTTRDAQVGQHQAKLYADCLEQMTGRRPVICYTNGYQCWLWDDAAGYPPRQVSGFYTRDELELMVQRRQTRLPLTQAPIDHEIAGRHYQTRAIRAVGEAFQARRREALLVMATGSGKTRTAIALVGQLMEQGWVKRVLFLADRQTLVTQATAAFTKHLPSTPTVNLLEEKATDARVYVSTYQTMMGVIKPTDEGENRYGAGFFDLIIIDEAHRSVYHKYKAIFDWFDAMRIGLTATPKDDIDRNTYSLFNLENGVPTDVYSLDEAVAQGYLVPPVPVSVPLRFLREGIHYNQLSDAEKDEWDSLEWNEEGDIPDSVNVEELNRWLFNADTVDKVLHTLMTQGAKVAGGDRIGKTIIFAKNTAHARFIQQRFDAAYPQYGGAFAQVITHDVDYKDDLIAQFGKADQQPHIAISVDLLDTGIDIHDVVNLVFFKVVRSVSKFWQMMGRGTRLRPDLFGPGEDKQNFFVFDFCMNLEFFNQPAASASGSLQKSLTQRLFETRLSLLEALDLEPHNHPDNKGSGDGTTSVEGLRHDTARLLHKRVQAMNQDNFVVRPHREWVRRYSDWQQWSTLDLTEIPAIAEHLAGLPSMLADDEEKAKRFDLLMLNLQLATLTANLGAVEKLRATVQQIASSLLGKLSIPSVSAHHALLLEVAEDSWWVDVSLPMLELARRRIRALVQFLDKTQQQPVYTNFADELGPATVVELNAVIVGTDLERFTAKARAWLREHENHLALHKLRRNLQLTQRDLDELEALLVSAGVGSPEQITSAGTQGGGLGLFIRSLVGLDRKAATQAFAEFLTDSRCNAAQLRFIQMIIDQLTANGVVPASRLYEAPFTDYAPTGPDELFPTADVDRMVEILATVHRQAQAA